MSWVWIVVATEKWQPQCKNSHKITTQYEDIVPHLSIPDEHCQVEEVEKLQQNHNNSNDTCNLETDHKGNDDLSSEKQANDYVVSDVPFISLDLFDKCIKSWVVHFEIFGIWSKGESDKHQKDLNESEDSQGKGECFELWLSIYGCHLHETRQEENVEDEADDPHR